MRYDHSAFPVDEYGRTIGLLTLRKVRRTPSDQWPISRVRDHMVPLGGQVVVVPPRMGRRSSRWPSFEDGEAGRVLAAEDGEVVGIVGPLISPGGCGVRNTRAAVRSTPERTAGNWTGGTEE